jgi:hypothetical protein
MKYYQTTRDGLETKRKYAIKVKDVKCFLDFDGDKVAVEFRIDTQDLQQSTPVRPILIFKSDALLTQENPYEILSTVINISEIAPTSTKITITASIQNIFLNIFSDYVKDFTLLLVYKVNSIGYQTTFIAQIPDIEKS